MTSLLIGNVATLGVLAIIWPMSPVHNMFLKIVLTVGALTNLLYLVGGN